jgi:hypothetical protein
MHAPAHFFFFLVLLYILRISLYALSFWATLTTEPTAATVAAMNVAHSSIYRRGLETHRLVEYNSPGPLPPVSYPPAGKGSSEHEVVMVTLSPMLIGVVGCL